MVRITFESYGVGSAEYPGVPAKGDRISLPRIGVVTVTGVTFYPADGKDEGYVRVDYS